MGIARHIIRLNAQGEYTFGNGMSLAFNAGYDDTRTMAIFDADRSNEEHVYGAIPALSETKSYELRLQSAADQRFRWTVGSNYYDGQFESSFGGGGSVVYQVRTSPLAPIATAPVRTATPAGTISTNGERAKVTAFFGAAEFDITDKLSIEAEIRRQTDDGVLPGIANVADSDELDSFEVGSKQQLFDGRLQYTLAAYFMKWKNLKANWQHAEYTNFVNPFLAQLTSNVTRFDGNELPRVPDVSASLASTYRGRLNDDWGWFVRGDAIYTGRGWDFVFRNVYQGSASRREWWSAYPTSATWACACPTSSRRAAVARSARGRRPGGRGGASSGRRRAAGAGHRRVAPAAVGGTRRGGPRRIGPEQQHQCGTDQHRGDRDQQAGPIAAGGVEDPAERHRS
jgi:hypothetical protein